MTRPEPLAPPRADTPADPSAPDPATEFAGIVADVLEADPRTVTDSAGPETLASWTSLRHLQLIVTLEEAYGVSFSYQEIRDLRTIGAVRHLLGAKGASV